MSPMWVFIPVPGVRRFLHSTSRMCSLMRRSGNTFRCVEQDRVDTLSVFFLLQGSLGVVREGFPTFTCSHTERPSMQALKRLMSYAQMKFPSDPSKSLEFAGLDGSLHGLN